MKKSHSPVMFWIKQLIIISLVIIAGIVAERVWKEGYSTDSETNSDLSPSESFSRMYANFRLSSRQPHPTSTGDFVIDLPTSQDSLSYQLKEMITPYNAGESDWAGMSQYRSFRQGSTLKEGLTKHLEKGGLRLLWDLNQDFIIKNRFETNGTLVESVKVITSSIQHNFSNPIELLKCPQQRTIVVTTQKIKNTPISEMCQSLK